MKRAYPGDSDGGDGGGVVGQPRMQQLLAQASMARQRAQALVPAFAALPPTVAPAAPLTTGGAASSVAAPPTVPHPLAHSDLPHDWRVPFDHDRVFDKAATQPLPGFDGWYTVTTRASPQQRFKMHVLYEYDAKDVLDAVHIDEAIAGQAAPPRYTFHIFDPVRRRRVPVTIYDETHSPIRGDVGARELQPSPVAFFGNVAGARAAAAQRTASGTFFRGTDINALFGVMRLAKQYPSACVPKIEVQSHRGHVTVQPATSVFWNIYDASRREMIVGDKFDETMRECLDNPRVRFVVGLIAMATTKDGHANAYVYDKRTQSVEVFEPHGADAEWTDLEFHKSEMNDKLRQLFERYGARRVYLASDFCPVGIQGAQVTERRPKLADPAGFCQAWSLWWIHYRLAHSDDPLTNAELYQKARSEFAQHPDRLTEFIRSYANGIDEQKAWLGTAAKAKATQDDELRKLTTEGMATVSRMEEVRKKLVRARAEGTEISQALRSEFRDAKTSMDRVIRATTTRRDVIMMGVLAYMLQSGVGA